MPHGHGVDNCSVRFCRKGRQLDLGESRSPTQSSQRNSLPASHQLWVYVCTFGPGQMVGDEGDGDVGDGDVGDGDVGDGDVGDGDVGDGDVGDGDGSIRSTWTSRLAMSTLASKLPQT